MGVVFQVAVGLELEGAAEKGKSFLIFAVADAGLGVGDESFALEGFDLLGLLEAVDGFGHVALVGVEIGKLYEGVPVESIALDDLIEQFDGGFVVAFRAGD